MAQNHVEPPAVAEPSLTPTCRAIVGPGQAPTTIRDNCRASVNGHPKVCPKVGPPVAMASPTLSAAARRGAGEGTLRERGGRRGRPLGRRGLAGDAALCRGRDRPARSTRCLPGPDADDRGPQARRRSGSRSRLHPPRRRTAGRRDERRPVLARRRDHPRRAGRRRARSGRHRRAPHRRRAARRGRSRGRGRRGHVLRPGRLSPPRGDGRPPDRAAGARADRAGQRREPVRGRGADDPLVQQRARRRPAPRASR